MERMNIAVTSKYWDGECCYEINVLIVNEETRIKREYVFYANSGLTKLNCTLCEDGGYIDDARRAAVNHMNQLRSIKNEGKLFYRIIAKIKKHFQKKSENKKASKK